MYKAHFQENLLKTSVKNHLKMVQFCRPLENYLGIDYFYYYRMTKDGYFSFISNHLEFNELIFDQNYHSYWPYIRDYSFFQKEVKFFDYHKDSVFKTVLNVAYKKFNFNLIFQILDKNAAMVEGFCFGSSHDRYKITNRCLSEMNLLHLFAQQFKMNFSSQLYEMENYQVSMKEELGPTFLNNLLVNSSPLISREDFFAKIGFKNIKALSNREIEILQLMLKGYSVTYIAECLLRSRRTVETHLENIKNKLNCHNKTELLEKGKFLIPPYF